MIWDLVCGEQNDKISGHEEETGDTQLLLLKVCLFFLCLSNYNFIILLKIAVDSVQYFTCNRV